MKGRLQKAKKTPPQKKKPPKALPLSHKPILLRNPTNIGRGEKQYCFEGNPILLRAPYTIQANTPAA